MNATKRRIIIRDIVFIIALGYFYFRPDASFRGIVFILAVIVLLIGSINEIRCRVNSPKSDSLQI